MCSIPCSLFNGLPAWLLFWKSIFQTLYLLLQVKVNVSLRQTYVRTDKQYSTYIRTHVQLCAHAVINWSALPHTRCTAADIVWPSPARLHSPPLRCVEHTSLSPSNLQALAPSYMPPTVHTYVRKLYVHCTKCTYTYVCIYAYTVQYTSNNGIASHIRKFAYLKVYKNILWIVKRAQRVDLPTYIQTVKMIYWKLYYVCMYCTYILYVHMQFVALCTRLLIMYIHTY